MVSSVVPCAGELPWQLTRAAVLGVVGLGGVGLPLVMELVHAGFCVIGEDVSERVLELLRSGESHSQDVPNRQVHAAVASGEGWSTLPIATGSVARSRDDSAHPLRLLPQEVHQHELPQAHRIGKVRLAAADLAHPLHELD